MKAPSGSTLAVSLCLLSTHPTPHHRCLHYTVYSTSTPKTWPSHLLFCLFLVWVQKLNYSCLGEVAEPHRVFFPFILHHFHWRLLSSYFTLLFIYLIVPFLPLSLCSDWGWGQGSSRLSGVMKVFIPSQPSLSLSLCISAVNTLSCNRLSTDRKWLDAHLIGQETTFSAPIQFPSVNEVNRGCPFSNRWMDFFFFSPPVASLLVCPLTVFLALPLSLKRSFWSWDHAQKKGTDLYADSSSTDSSLSHTNT